MKEYKTIPGVSSEAVSLILDAACNTALADLSRSCTEYELGMHAGFVAALGAILSSEEIPAHNVLAQALAEENDGDTYCVVLTEFGGHDSNIDVYGPYTLKDARAKSRDLEASGYCNIEDDPARISTMTQEIVRMEKGGITDDTDDRAEVRGR